MVSDVSCRCIFILFLTVSILNFLVLIGSSRLFHDSIMSKAIWPVLAYDLAFSLLDFILEGLAWDCASLSSSDMAVGKRLFVCWYINLRKSFLQRSLTLIILVVVNILLV